MVRGALDGPIGEVGTVNTSKQHSPGRMILVNERPIQCSKRVHLYMRAGSLLTVGQL